MSRGTRLPYFGIPLFEEVEALGLGDFFDGARVAGGARNPDAAAFAAGRLRHEDSPSSPWRPGCGGYARPPFGRASAGSPAGRLAVGPARRPGSAGSGRRSATASRSARHGAGGQNDAPLDGVAQLADVSGPGVAEQGLSHRLGKPGDRLAVLPGEEPQQVLGQRAGCRPAGRAAAARSLR